MFKFGGVAFTVGDDVNVRVLCLGPQTMKILGVDFADVHDNGRAL